MVRQDQILLAIVREFGLGPRPGRPTPQLGLDGRSAAIARPPRLAGLTALTVVVADLAAASPILAAQLGGPGRAADPVDLDEAGLAQVFDLEGCQLLVLEPADDTAAEDFLLARGPGVYRLTLGGAHHDPATVARAADPARGWADVAGAFATARVVAAD